MELLGGTGVGRDINRHHYGRTELEAQLTRPVVKDLISLIRLRNDHPAFSGAFSLQESHAATIAMRWVLGQHFAELKVQLATAEYELSYSADAAVQGLQFTSAPPKTT